MTRLLFVLLGLASLFREVSADSTSSSCPAPDGNTRSLWSILGSCALTLLICIWHALHPDVPKLGRRGYEIWLKRMGFVLLSFFVPEVVVGRAGEEWCNAHRQVKKFRDKGYEWSTTHSYFCQMHGFVYRDEKGVLSMIDSDKFLELCKAGKIADPLISEKEIKGWGKSDAVGKAIFALQLFWFMLQVVVRGSKDLAITLVELDTVCMAVLALVYLFFWWDKPLRPDSPHVFCYTGDNKVYSQRELSNVWKQEPSCWHTLINYLVCMRKSQSIVDREGLLEHTDNSGIIVSKHSRLVAIVENLDAVNVYNTSLLITWTILGCLHLIAWNFEFPTGTEKTMWRVASLVLAGSSLTLFVVAEALEYGWIHQVVASVAANFVSGLGVVSRVMLVGLMLASLRALPCSAHETVSWTAYIPHL